MGLWCARSHVPASICRIRMLGGVVVSQRRNALFFGGKGAVVGLLDLGLFYPAGVVNSSDLQYTGRAV